VGLRIRITGKTVNADRTLTVNYVIAWADASGVEKWSESRQTVYPSDVTRAQVLTDLQAEATSKAGLIAAALALDADLDKTYERQPDGSWKAV